MSKDGKFDKGRYTTIPETKNIKLPIGGKIRLGIRVKNEKGIEYPQETDYFVCPKEVKKFYGDEPTELTVFFPVADREKVFPQNYEKYGSNEALQCWGDGEKSAQRLDLETGKWKDVKCPCGNYGPYDKKNKVGGCVKAGYLKFMIPSVSIGTFYQCRIGGIVSIEECNSAFKLAEATTGGCWAMIPFRMKRIPKKLKIPGTANMKTHWVVTLEIAASTEEIRRVMSGEILYLGQKKDSQYELEDTEPAEAKVDEEVEETPEEAEARELEKAEQDKEDLKAVEDEFKEERAREADLKKAREAGGASIRTTAEAKKVSEARKTKIAEIEKVARAYKVNTWAEIIEIGVRYGIFYEGIAGSQAKTYICDHKNVYDALWQAIKTDQEVADEDLPKD